MTKNTIPEGARAGFTTELKAQRKQGARAVLLLEQAVATLHADEPGEDAATKAQRLRGAAVLIHTAGLELAVTCGWNEAAHAAEQADLIDEEG